MPISGQDTLKTRKTLSVAGKDYDYFSIPAAEAEIGATFDNGRDTIIIKTTLEEMGHPQPPTPVQVDNSTADAFANGTLKQQRSRWS